MELDSTCRSLDEPDRVSEDSLRGGGAACPEGLARVPGGVVHSRPCEGRVAVVVCGGSGHYPAFSGVVGSGPALGRARPLAERGVGTPEAGAAALPASEGP